MNNFFGFLSNTKISKQEHYALIQLTGMESVYKEDFLLLNFKGNGFENEKNVVLFNGRIYNLNDLENMLNINDNKAGMQTTEQLLLNLYQDQGENFAKHLRGAFSIIIWDKQNRILFAARDHFGMKPLYYMETLKGLYFASDAKYLYHIRKNREISKTALQNYLTFQYVPEPDTMAEGICALEPGSLLIKKYGEGNVLSIKKYWSVSLKPVSESLDEKIREIRDALAESVVRHMQADGPAGCFLSGGIDSAIITALAKEVDPGIKTFTAGFDVEGYNEINLAEEIADFYKLDNISRVIGPEEFAEDMPKIIWHMGVPVADPAAVPLYFIAREAKKHVDTVLSGEGSDELFGGYNIYREPLDLRIFNHVPQKLKNILLSLSQVIPEGVKGKGFIERGCTPVEERYAGNSHIFKESEKSRFLKKYDDSCSFTLVTRPYYSRVQDYNDVEKMQYIDLHTWLTGDILVKTHRMTEAHSLELRCPFLDLKVFNAASKLALEDKIQGSTTKYLLRRAFSHILPKNVTKRKKLGYPVPIRVWLKDELYNWAVDIVKSSSADEYINKAEVIRLIDEHRKGRADNSRKIWTMLVFLMWFEIFFPDGSEEAPAKTGNRVYLAV